MSGQPSPGPLICVVRPSQIPRSGRTVEIAASAVQCAGVRDVLEIERLDALTATVTLVPGEDGGLEVRARIRATMGRCCVVSLKIFTTEIDTTFQEIFHPLSGDGKAPQTEIIIDPEGPDAAESYSNDEIDLGALVVEHLALALDPHPRAPDAPTATGVLDTLGLEKRLAAKVTMADREGATSRPSPFAALAGLGVRENGDKDGNGN